MQIPKTFYIISGILAAALVFYLLYVQFIRKPVPVPADAISIPMEEFISESPSNNTEPYDVRVLNTSESSFTIFFRTKLKTKAKVIVGKDRLLNRTVLDSRDSRTNQQEYYNHFFEFSDPASIPETTYQYLIEVNEKRFDNDGRLYSADVAPLLSSPPSVISFEGVNSITHDSSFTDTFLIATAYNNNQAASNYVGDELSDSNFLVSLGGMRAENLGSYINPDQLTIELFSAEKYYKSKEILDFNPDSVYNLLVQ